MIVVVYIAIYAGLLICVAGCLRRLLEYARTPMHLRWELYPVLHEEPRRVDHGGSYFESGEWWLSPQSVHHRREWAAMFREIAFLKGLREFNPRLWLPSFLFHFGLYLSIVSVVLAAGAQLAGMISNPSSAWHWTAVSLVYGWIGSSGLALIFAGAIWLLVRRITDSKLRNYTSAGDIFNLLFFIVTVALLLAGYVTRAQGSASLGEIAHGIFRFDRSIAIGGAFGVGLIAASALVAYIPFTHMSHFIAKYFTWHSVRWDDRRNQRGSRMEDRIATCLSYAPTWSARHISAEGRRSWAEIAATNPTEEIRK